MRPRRAKPRWRASLGPNGLILLDSAKEKVIMSLTPHAHDIGYELRPEGKAAGAPARFEEMEMTPEMARVGGDCLDEFVREGSGLVCTPDYVAEKVYLAMEKRRRGM